MPGQDGIDPMELDLFALDSDDDSDSNSTSTPLMTNRDDISISGSECSDDDCCYSSSDHSIDAHAIASTVRGHPTKRQRVDSLPKDRRPIAFVRFNTRVGKAKPVLIKALLDSGASESLVTKQYTAKLKVNVTLPVGPHQTET